MTANLPTYLPTHLPIYLHIIHMYIMQEVGYGPHSAGPLDVSDVQRARTHWQRHACQIGATYIYIHIVVYIVVALFKSRGFTFVQDVSSKRVHHVM